MKTINRNKFAKLDYVVLPTTKNPVYKFRRLDLVVFAAVIFLLCFNIG